MTQNGRGYSSVVEHSTADREVPGSNPGAPFVFFLICVGQTFFSRRRASNMAQCGRAIDPGHGYLPAAPIRSGTQTRKIGSPRAPSYAPPASEEELPSLSVISNRLDKQLRKKSFALARKTTQFLALCYSLTEIA